MDVPYEELVEDHRSWSRKIIKFIVLDWDERWRNYEKYVTLLLELRS